MVTYNFKTIQVVPTAKMLVDIVLQRTQRKTPTVVRRSWKITRIREFYMTKVKFTQQTYHDRLSKILEDFPRLEELHPFYASLINVLYSKDHYKLALGQINTARNVIEKIGKDYIKMLKFGDSLYRCKQNKRAALGRMCTLMKKLKASLGYLEEVRQHLSRLPSINPSTRTLMITGYPNVGKSQFMNKVSRANVDVQPYAFTTKSLWVGHFDYRYMKWQVIDSPGILDHPLEDRNTIEMQAITALAHLHTCILYFIDISETCGYSIKQQCALYHSIKPLFVNKPVMIVCNKTDLRKMEDLDAEDTALIQGVVSDRQATMIAMSNVTEDNIDKVKNTACDILLSDRVERKTKKLESRVDDVINRIHVARPQARDSKPRPTAIPESVPRAGSAMEDVHRRTQRDVEAEQGGAGVYNANFREHWVLKNENWKFDVIPEIVDGKNVMDHVDEDIDQHLAALEAEEELLEAQAEAAGALEEDMSDVDEDIKEAVEEIKTEKAVRMADNAARKTLSHHVPLPRAARARSKTIGDVESHMADLGLPADKVMERVRSRSKSRGVLGKRTRSRSKGARDGMEDVEEMKAVGGSAAGFVAAAALVAPTTRDHGIRNVKRKVDAEKLKRRAQKATRKTQNHQSGEGDRHHYDAKPKHLFSGKTSLGTRDWR